MRQRLRYEWFYSYNELKSISCSMGRAPSFIVYKQTLLSTEDKKS
jgi:hypothetical protein